MEDQFGVCESSTKLHMFTDPICPVPTTPVGSTFASGTIETTPIAPFPCTPVTSIV